MHRDVVGKTAGISLTSTKISDANSNDSVLDNGLNLRDNSLKIARPKSEEIPLEDMSQRKSFSTPNSSMCLEQKDSFILGSLCNPEATALASKKDSEETSFTSSSQNDELKARRRGQVETV